MEGSEWISAIASETCFIIREFLFGVTDLTLSEPPAFENILLLILLTCPKCLNFVI